MRVLMLPEPDVLARERAMLQRLEIGLADDGVRVLHAVPWSMIQSGHDESTGLYSTPIGWYDSGPPFTQSLRARLLARSIRAAAPAASARALDVVHAIGRASWAVGADVARRARAGLVLELTDPADVAPAAALAARFGASAEAPALDLQNPPTPRGTCILSCAGQRIADAAAAKLGPHAALASNWGVHPGDPHRPPLDPDRSLTVAILSTGTNPAALRATLEGLARLATRAPGLVILLDADLAAKLPIWAWVCGPRAAPPLSAPAPNAAPNTTTATPRPDAPGLAQRLSLIADLESKRDATLRADILAIAEPLQQHRTLVLDAMANGMLVVAPPGDAVDILIPGQTCESVPPAPASAPIADAWADAIWRLATDHPRAAALRDSAARFVATSRPASRHVLATLRAYELAAGVRADGSPLEAEIKR